MSSGAAEVEAQQAMEESDMLPSRPRSIEQETYEEVQKIRRDHELAKAIILMFVYFGAGVLIGRGLAEIVERVF